MISRSFTRFLHMTSSVNKPGIAAGYNIDPKWINVDSYFNTKLLHKDQGLEHALESHEKNNLPQINLPPQQGKLLSFLVEMSHSRRVLEIGTLAGYSTLWLARALQNQKDTKLVTIEYSNKNADIAEDNFRFAGVKDFIELRRGDAKKVLDDLISEKQQFDFVFIDADKGGYTTYLEKSLKLVSKGAWIIADNVVRQGKVIDETCTVNDVKGIRDFLEYVEKCEKVDAVAIQTVCAKGYDGFALLKVI